MYRWYKNLTQWYQVCKCLQSKCAFVFFCKQGGLQTILKYELQNDYKVLLIFLMDNNNINSMNGSCSRTRELLEIEYVFFILLLF